MADLYTLGNFTIDDVVFYDGRTRMGTPGGNVLYAGQGAQLWCDRVGILARLGSDFPPAVRNALDTLGLELNLIPVPLPNIHNWALYEADGTRQFVNHRASGTNDDLSLRANEVAPARRAARGYHIASMPAERQHELVNALKRPENVVTLDPHEWWVKDYIALHLNMMAAVDAYLPSREEAQLLYGRDDPEAAARAFVTEGKAHVVVIKLGGVGALVYEGETRQLTHVPIYPVRVLDETGAGDSFCGGFLAGYAATHDAVHAACCGAVSASFCVETIGSIPVARPARAEALARLADVRARCTAFNSGR